MGDDNLTSLCRAFITRLNGCAAENYDGQPFFPNGTANDIFRSNLQELRDLLRCLLRIHSDDQLSGIVKRILKDHSNVLAILLLIRLPSDELERYVRKIPNGNASGQTNCLTDDRLPVNLNDAQRLFPDLADNFYGMQFQFCPVTLRKHREASYDNDKRRCPLPYLSQETIGEGSFGRVYKVKVASRQWESKDGRNDTPRLLARKEFEINRRNAFYEEKLVLDWIRKQRTKHGNVAVHLASLQHGSTFSLFFDLASCNLWEYLSGGEACKTLQSYPGESYKPSNLKEKAAIFGRGRDVAGALAFLHTRFESDEFKNVACYHLDLKPHNILVFDAYQEDRERWKITDFGLSRVKSWKTPVGDIRLPFTRRPEIPGTRNNRGEGTYLAPEADKGKMRMESDVWSFGCIFSLVLSYIDGGPNRVKEFQRQRTQLQSHNDCFYITDYKYRHILSPVVTNWFIGLEESANARGNPEARVFQETLEFLRKKALNPEWSKRAATEKLYNELRRISSIFNSQQSMPSPNPHRNSSGRSFRRALSSRPQKLGVSNMTGSTFSPGGKLLAFYSSRTIVVFDIERIQQAPALHNPQPTFSFPAENGPWQCCAISSTYLCAWRQASSFECYIYPIPAFLSAGNSNVIEGRRVSFPNIGQIRETALSPDGMFIAFAAYSSPSFTDPARTILFIFETQRLINGSTEGNPSPPTSRSSSLASDASSNQSLGGNSYTVPRLHSVGHIKHISSLAFSSNSRYLIMCAQDELRSLFIQAWETTRDAFPVKFFIPYQVKSTPRV